MSTRKISDQITEIYNKTRLFGRKGMEGYIQYVEYISTLIEEERYYIFEEMMTRKYHSDMTKWRSVEESNRSSFDIIRFDCLSNFQEEQKRLYQTYNVIQIGFKIIHNDFGDLGEIQEVGYDKSSNYLYRDSTLSLILDSAKIIDLNVYRKDNEILIVSDNEKSLIEKYKISLEFLTEDLDSAS